jgi:ferric-dicitrate binding protein FerR (iron transport regulator)
MKRKDVKLLIKKYQEGKATETEKAILESWYLQRDVHAIEDLTEEQFREDLLSISAGLPLVSPVRKIAWWPRIAAAAAVLTVFLSAYLAWPILQRHPHPLQLSVLHIAGGQKKQITLADGTTIWLNAGSELKYPPSFVGHTREVYLSGEAYFDVYHDAAKPFIIHTGKVTTTVLGTAFDIKEYKNAHLIVVTVIRGKVSVAKDTRRLAILTPDQQISFNTANEQVVLRHIDAGQVTAWEKIDLHFEDVTFAEAARQLEKRFNVKINFTNERIKNCRFSGGSLTGEKLDIILKTMCDFNNATYKIDSNGSILIDGQGCD